MSNANILQQDFTSCRVIKAIVSWNEDLDTALQTLPSVIVAVASIVKFFNAIIQKNKMIILLARIKEDYEALLNAPEWTIMTCYIMNGRKFAIYFTAFMWTMAVLYGLMPLSPICMDFLLPLNHTRKRKFLLEVEYMVDADKYYFPIMVHEYVGVSMVVHIVVALDTMFMTHVQHACGLFAVAGARMKYMHLTGEAFIETENADRFGAFYVKYEYTESEGREIYEKLRDGIEIHKSAITYCNLLESYITQSAAIVVLFNLLSISISGIQLVLNIDNADDVVKYASLLVGELNHLFFLCLPGQRLLDYSHKLYEDACEAVWHSVPKNLQTLYKLVVLRSMTPAKLTAGKIVPLSMETFLSVVQTAMSYFTFLSSMR